MDSYYRTQLSERERQIVKLAGAGLIDAAIAQRLGISESTVSTYWSRIRIKLGPYTRPELVAIVIKEEGDKLIASLQKENAKLAKRLRMDSGEYGIDGNFYKDLLEIAMDSMVIVNTDGGIDGINRAAAELFGYTKEELEGQHVSILIPARFHADHEAHHDGYKANPTNKLMGDHNGTLAKHKDGHEFRISAALSALEVESGITVLCIIRPLNEDI